LCLKAKKKKKRPKKKKKADCDKDPMEDLVCELDFEK
jgi:hypothetical protein